MQLWAGGRSPADRGHQVSHPRPLRRLEAPDLRRDLLTGHPIQRQKTGHLRTAIEAQRELVTFQGEVSTEFGLANAGAPKTLNDLLTRFAAHQESSGRSPRTIDATEKTRDNVIGPYLGTVTLRDLSPQHLNAFYERLRGRDGSATSHRFARRFAGRPPAASVPKSAWVLARPDCPGEGFARWVCTAISSFRG